MSQNEFFSYDISEDNDGFYLMMYDLDREEHEICFTHDLKIAEHLKKHFDNMAIADERELFENV